MASEQNFLIDLPEGVKQNLSGALNHIMETTEHKLPAEAGASIDIRDIPDEELMSLSESIYRAVRNHRIRMHFTYLRQQGLNVEEACKELEQKIHLHPDYIKNIAYRK